MILSKALIIIEMLMTTSLVTVAVNGGVILFPRQNGQPCPNVRQSSPLSHDVHDLISLKYRLVHTVTA